MRHKERIDVKNIREKEIVKVVSIGQKDVRFRLQNAYVGQVGDKSLLDILSTHREWTLHRYFRR